MGIKVPEKNILVSHIRYCLVFHTPKAIVRLPFASAIFYTEQMVVKAAAEVKLKKQGLIFFQIKVFRYEQNDCT
jgi:hypothetical protein